jgi:hypothetical protein
MQNNPNLQPDDVPFSDAFMAVLEKAIEENVIGHTWADYTYSLRFRARREIKNDDIIINNIEMAGPVSVIDHKGTEKIPIGSVPITVSIGEDNGNAH